MNNGWPRAAYWPDRRNWRVRSGSWADNATVERREAGSRFCAGRPTPRKRGVAPYERDNR